MNGVLDTAQQEEASRSIETEITREQTHIGFLNGCFIKGNKRSRLRDRHSLSYLSQINPSQKKRHNLGGFPSTKKFMRYFFHGKRGIFLVGDR